MESPCKWYEKEDCGKYDPNAKYRGGRCTCKFNKMIPILGSVALLSVIGIYLIRKK